MPQPDATPAGPWSLAAAFRIVLAARFWILGFYAALLVPAASLALKVGQDGSVERLIVRTDPDAVAASAFESAFGGGESVILLAEAEDPFAPPVLGRLDAMERELAAIPGVSVQSALSVYRRARGEVPAGPAATVAVRGFAEGTRLFARQGLIGPRYLTTILALDPGTVGERRALLRAIDRVVEPIRMDPFPLQALRKTGVPYVNAYFEDATRSSTARHLPIFGAFVVVLILFLYRSFRALAAFLATIGTSLVLTIGYAGLSGNVFTIVSSLVPMTVLVTCTATLVYVHSRFVDHPPGATVEEHRLATLANKFVPCTASLFATAVGFAALTASSIRPIREMGAWVAAGVGITWIVVFTLFPALQCVLRTPTEQERRVRGRRFLSLAERIPEFTRRHRFPLVLAAIGLSAIGAASLFGIPGLIEPMPLGTDALEYIDGDLPLARDTARVQGVLPGRSVTEAWLRGPAGALTSPETLRGIERFCREVERLDGVQSAIGVTTVLRLLRYLDGEGDRFPTDPSEVESLAARLETLLLHEPELHAFVDMKTLAGTRVTVVTRAASWEDQEEVDRGIRAAWETAAAGEPGLSGFEMTTTGSERLQSKIAHHLVPTLVESFGITAAVLFLAFLVLFRSGPARLMAMIPSVFAILVMFAFMRLTGIGLNVATILIASTVLGTSENDQIHFFYHYLEGRRNGDVGEGLRHSLAVAGKAIGFATLINAGGFLAFALSDLPPMRHLGILSALAFALSMLADFTALPAALWILSGRKGHSGERAGGRGSP